ncbi:MAG: periplasmic heavy metal sensor [bacterium]|nr:periplasmic heavy metal sensor [bacterium]
MNRLLRLLLLVSFGLNVGLGWALLRDRPEGRVGRPGAVSGHAWRERPAPDDTAAWRRMMDRRIERLSGRLDLDPDQADRLHRLQQGNGPVMHAARQRVETGRQAVRAAVDADGFGDGQVRVALRDLRRAQADLDSLAQEFLLQEFAVLTPEQREHYARILPLDPWRGPGADGPRGPGEGPHRGGGRRPVTE